MAIYSFEFRDITQSATSSAAPASQTAASNISNGIDDAASGQSNAFVEGAAKRAEGLVVQQALTPLNTVTGGLASPAYQVGKSILSGASGGAIGGAVVGLVMQGIKLAVGEVEKRIAKMEAKANDLNERDNQLIKSGFKVEPTFYQGNFWGVKATDRR